jgi:hypothetical protein
VVGAREVIPDLEGNVENTYEHLYQYLRIIDERQCNKLIVIGDSTLVIKLMLKVSSSSNGSLVKTITRIKQEISRFEEH